MDLAREAPVGRNDSGDMDGPISRVGLPRRGQGEHPHEREYEHRQKPQ
jgi:hypothetical protein